MNDSSIYYEPNMNISTLTKRVLILFSVFLKPDKPEMSTCIPPPATR